MREWFDVFRYDLASLNEPRIIFIDNLTGKRSEAPRLGYVVLPALNRYVGSRAYRWVSDRK